MARDALDLWFDEIDPAEIPGWEKHLSPAGRRVMDALTQAGNQEGLQTFIRSAGREPLLDRDYWMLLRETWIGHDVTYPNAATWQMLFTSRRPRREWLMYPSEREHLERLPAELTVRGFSDPDGQEAASRGLAWTLNREVAERLAVLSQGSPKLAEGVAQKSDVIAYLAERQESEVLVLPEMVDDIRTEHVEVKEEGD